MRTQKITLIKNFFLVLLFTLLCTTLLSHHNRLKTTGSVAYAASTQFIPTPTHIPSPTYTPSPTRTTKPRPTITPTSIPTTAPSPNSVPFVQTINSVSIRVVSGSPLLDKVNEYRRSKGLAAVKSESYTCDLAKKRAEEIKSNFSHDGFQQRMDSKNLGYPTYSNVTENIAQGGSPIDMWLNSPLHRENMEKDTPYVCIEQSGDFYAYEGWKP